ncbi:MULTISPECIES: response regulator [Roseomonadaceae]|uniref:Response regulator n=1 Tax=Falsiroseomonas oleicola TaxID=2801474 RepID=A0ABS6H0B7_9PROT|nr:response regulator [Roseomonas oleicola]MBU8542107.1 response regulator [Roseomonas oleicola]
MSSRSVLLVEDDRLTAMAAEQALSRAGFQVVGHVEDEASALRRAQQPAPDYAVVDLDLAGGGSGLRVGEALAAAGVRVVYATGHGPAWRQEMEDSGAKACLAKPYAAEDVPAALEVLERLLRGQQAPAVPEGMHLFID